MNEPTKSQQFSLVELVACLFGMIAMIWLLRWSWQRFDGVGLVVTLLSPFIGLLCGGILILVLAWSVAACGCLFSAEFRREFRESRDELRSMSGDLPTEGQEIEQSS